MYFKHHLDEYYSLQEVSNYMKLFEINIDAIELRILLSLDKNYTNEINQILQQSKSQPSTSE
jgi:hypothetical protein